ncbi:hypothetical protein J3B00_001055 [Pseudomonas sp. BP8]|nr:hypothetical protein [Pseudomonas sp. BP8]
MSVCGMRREGLSWIALGGWYFWGGRLGAYPFDVVDYLAPSALTAGHFFSWKKVTKNRLLHHTALRCATGSLAPVLLREDRAVRPLLGLSAFRPSMASTSLRKTCARPPEVAGRSKARSRSTARATAGESLRSRFCLFTSGFVGWLAGLRPAICIGCTGLFAGQARSYRDCADFGFGAIPVGAGLPREEARISTPPATLKTTPAQTPPVTSRRQEAERRSRSTGTATAGESLRSRFVYLPADLWCGWAGLRPAICIGSTGLFAGQARSYRFSADFEFGAVPASSRGMSDRRTAAPTGLAQILDSAHKPVGAGLPREEARISTTHATIKNKASPDATRNFATSGGRVEVLRREVEAMDGRKALRPRRGRTARLSRSKTGARGPVA